MAIAETFKHTFWGPDRPYGLRHFDNPHTLYETARLFWGWDAIVAMAVGECCELGAALVRRDYQERQCDWKGEVVDVIVMREQLALLWPEAYISVLDEHYDLPADPLPPLAEAIALLTQDSTPSRAKILVNMTTAAEVAWPGLYSDKEFHLRKAHKIRRLERKVYRIYQQAEWQETVKLAGIDVAGTKREQQ